jgi:hypothetical protein
MLSVALIMRALPACNEERSHAVADSGIDSSIDRAVCTPACAGRNCGPDGCEGTCGAGCKAGESCDETSGVCKTGSCTPTCVGRLCGSDGCGGSCAPGCSFGQTCDEASGKCQGQPTTPSACTVADVQSCADIGDAAAQAKGCCQAGDAAAYCEANQLVQTDCKAFNTSCGEVANWGMNYCKPTGAKYCADVVAPKTTGQVLDYGTIQFNWEMACWNDDKPSDRSLFVFVEDYEQDDIALRFGLYVDANPPKVGVPFKMNAYAALAKPFYISMLSGIAFDRGGSYKAEFLVYAGTVTIKELNTTIPVGTQLKMEFTDLWGREIQATSGGCQDKVNGDRLRIKKLVIDITIGALHKDQDCIDWAGG